MSVLDDLMQQLSGGAVSQLSQRINADEGATMKAIQGALPMLVGALSKQAGNANGANSLLAALDRDHDGSIMDDIAGFFTGNVAPAGKTADGAGILRHILGDQRATAEIGLSKVSGLDTGRTGQLLSMLAPMVMGALGQQKKQRGLDAGGLMDLLGQEQKRVEQNSPNILGFVNKMLDKDGDGSIVDDLLSGVGGNLLGGLFGGGKKPS